MRRLRRAMRTLCLVLSFGLMAASVAFAQQNLGGTVSGRLLDPSGAVIPGVQITARNIETGVTRSTQSDTSGYYVLQLPVGVYTVTATKTNFKTSIQENVTVVVGGSVALDFHLQIGSTSTVVQVSASVTPLINPTSSAVQTSVSNALVSALPVEIAGSMRSATSFLELEAWLQCIPVRTECERRCVAKWWIPRRSGDTRRRRRGQRCSVLERGPRRGIWRSGSHFRCSGIYGHRGQC